MNELVDPDWIGWLLSLGIFLFAGALSVLTYLTYRRERDRKLLLVTVAYVLFALRGLATIIGPVAEGAFELQGLHPTLLVVVVEVFTHFSALLVLVGLALFFAATTRT